MPKYLRKRSGEILTIAVCPRCKMKRHYFDLERDPNTKQLVCRFGCVDIYDPYRLAPRKPDNITVKEPRPDEPLDVPNDYPYGSV